MNLEIIEYNPTETYQSISKRNFHSDGIVFEKLANIMDIKPLFHHIFKPLDMVNIQSYANKMHEEFKQIVSNILWK